MSQNKYQIRGAEILSSGCSLGIGTVMFEDGKIIGIEHGQMEAPDYQIIDAEGCYLIPGMIDIHIHGAGDSDFMDCTEEDCLTIARECARHGATMIFPTTLASDNEELFGFLDVYDKVKNQNVGAAFGGLHLEGPYFSYEFRGAQDPKYLRNPSPSEYMPILERTTDIRRWSLAPELPGAMDLAKVLVNRGIVASAGHTSALYSDMELAYQAGFRLITHFYSCMNSVVRRNAFRYGGCIEAGYLIDDMTVEVIGDGIHVPKELLQLIMKVKSPDKVILCTDSMRGAGMPDGMSILGSRTKGQQVLIEDNVAKLMDRSAFAGSVATTDRLLRTMHFLAGRPLEEAVLLVTENPAVMMGFGDRKGSIKKGFDADIAVLDKNLDVRQTWVGGRLVNNAY